MTEPAAARNLAPAGRSSGAAAIAPAAARTFFVETPQHRDMLAAFVGRKALPFQAQIGPIRERRSLPQNSRLWLLHTKASEVTGYTPLEAHEEMLCEHYGFTLKERKSPWTGEIELKREPLKRSSTRDKKEFAKFMEFCELFYGEKLGVWLGADE